MKRIMFAAITSVLLNAPYAVGETLTYYYVGAAPVYSNIADADRRSALNLGVLRVDVGRIPVGQDRENFRLRYSDQTLFDDEFAPDYLAYSLPDVVGCCFNGGGAGGASGEPSGFSFVDIEIKNGMVTDWSVATPGTGITNVLFSDKRGDSVILFAPGSEEGSYVQYATRQAGTWFHESELGAYSIAILNNSRDAILNPPESEYDVAPVPIPAPVALLTGAMGLLVLVGRRKRTPAITPPFC